MRAWVAVLCAVAACKSGKPPPPAPRPDLPHARPLTDRVFERTSARRERGRYLVEGVLQCFICHGERDEKLPGAPPIADRRGCGRVLSDEPAFFMVAPNITPDVETGAGSWTDDMFARAIREGIGHDGRALSGPMWWWAFRNLSDEDLASVVVFIRSLPPVRNPLPKRKLPPERERALLASPQPLTAPVPARDLSDPVARGRYLLRVADCAGCHSAFEAPVNPGLFGGGNEMHANLFSANITSSPTGISYYDDALFIEVMRTGRVKARELSVMPWVAFGHMTDDDLRAVFAALQRQPPVTHSVSNVDPPTDCPRCRQKHGLGENNKPKTYPAVTVASRLLDAYAGRYRFERGDVFELKRKDDHLVAIAEGMPPTDLHPLSDVEFDGDNLPVPITFVSDGDGRVSHIVWPEIDDEKIVRLPQ